jgi:hypothetical protein
MLERLQAELRRLLVTKDTQHFLAEPVQASGVAIAKLRQFGVSPAEQRAVVAEEPWKSGVIKGWNLDDWDLAILLNARSLEVSAPDKIPRVRSGLRQPVTTAAPAAALGMVQLGPALQDDPDWAAVLLGCAGAPPPWVRHGMPAAHGEAAGERRWLERPQCR